MDPGRGVQLTSYIPETLAFLNLNWAKYTKALDFVLRKINDRGLLSVTGNRDWARLNQGVKTPKPTYCKQPLHANPANDSRLYHTLVTASRLATWKGDQVATVSRFYSTRAQTLRNSINQRLFDAPGGAFRDSSARPQLHPQDANALAVVFEATTAARSRQISTRLTRNWTPIGPSSPELPGNISPFVTSIELRAHFLVGETARCTRPAAPHVGLVPARLPERHPEHHDRGLPHQTARGATAPQRGATATTPRTCRTRTAGRRGRRAR